MVKRRLGFVSLLVSICLCLLPCQVLAASTTDVKESISVDSECRLTVYYGYGGMAFQNQTVRLYKIAEASADCQYTLAPAFESSGLILNGIQTQGEWNVIRSTLEAQILADNLAPIKTAETDKAGQVSFAQLLPGLYLASAVKVTEDELTYSFDSVLVALPGLGMDGVWQYQVAVTAKPQVLSPEQSDEDVQLKVLKLWKGDERRADRPKDVEVEIFRDGLSYETVVLSAENNWSYSWTVKNDGASWKVVERNVPAGYTMSVEQRETAFVITNARQNTPDSPPPQTGDTSNILLYTVIMYVSGAMLIILGIVGKRKRHEETN